MNPVAQTNRFNPRKLALVFLCAMLVGATVLYLGKSPLFLCLYCVFSAFGQPPARGCCSRQLSSQEVGHAGKVYEVEDPEAA